MEPLEGKAQSTPVPSESALKNPRPGENTLKKELWTKFQAVSMGRMSYTDSVPQEAPKKDFLDLLEEDDVAGRLREKKKKNILKGAEKDPKNVDATPSKEGEHLRSLEETISDARGIGVGIRLL
ncbi:hypothetical protein KSP39_PZI007564 [Platanthera zijinensis]|uniref:Uncharacterized protein n=1 Tax=Platanthera zijinensis TaxID=2320716 RepID=A0AAP0BPU3_9ASPA